MASSDSKIEKIQTHFKALSSLAPTLNTASDELTKAVTVLDESFKKLNIGLTAWVTFRSRAVHPSLTDEAYDHDQIGYGKVEGKWGIALRHVWGNYASEEFGGEGPWLFNDAPRELRLLGVDKIPELIEALDKEASETTKQVQEKTKQVRELASVIEEMASEPRRMERPKKGDKVGRVGLSSVQIAAILAGVQQQQRFLGEIISQASRWELNGADLLINFPAEKHAFAEMVNGRESLAKVKGVVGQVFGRPVHVTVNTEDQTVNGPMAGSDKGSQ
jgi:hypothetical protein